jgi:hypothetical protein
MTQLQITTWQLLCICPAMWFSQHNCSNLLKMGYYICNGCHICTLFSIQPQLLKTYKLGTINTHYQKKHQISLPGILGEVWNWEKRKTQRSNSCCCLPWEKKSYLTSAFPLPQEDSRFSTPLYVSWSTKPCNKGVYCTELQWFYWGNWQERWYTLKK